MVRTSFVLLLLAATLALAQTKYTGPRPPKPDVPYLMHASNLIATEAIEAKEESRRDDIAYILPGANSEVQTPLASPIFLLQSEKIAPEQLEAYRMESKSGQREIVFSKKRRDKVQQFRLSVQRLGEGLYRLEIVESLENGEYCLTPKGVNQVFCFQVF
jgi:hypothetical protein